MGKLLAHKLESALRRGGDGQSRGQNGLLWWIELGAYGRKVRVAGNNSADILLKLRGNRLANVKKLDPPPSLTYLDTIQLIEDIVSVEPASRTFRLRDERWIRYTVRCCGHKVTTVAVSEDQLRANLYWGRTSLPFVPAHSRISWDDFVFEVLKAEPIGSWYEEPKVPSLAVIKPPIFHGRICPTCECINGSRSQRCHECGSRMDMPAEKILRTNPA